MEKIAEIIEADWNRFEARHSDEVKEMLRHEYGYIAMCDYVRCLTIILACKAMEN